jgi:hypothetical protein
MNLINAGKDPSAAFWAEIAPSHHLVQIYADEDVFLDALEGFVAGGLNGGDGLVIIATEAHREALDRRLEARGIELNAARAADRYISLDAADTLATFMVDGWPDEERFRNVVASLLARAGAGNRRVRAFGEMVALLWAEGQCGATVRLEYLWHRFCEQEGFSLLCAYPKSGFTADAAESIRQICDAHSHVVSADALLPRGVHSLNELTHKLHPLN